MDKNYFDAMFGNLHIGPRESTLESFSVKLSCWSFFELAQCANRLELSLMSTMLGLVWLLAI